MIYFVVLPGHTLNDEERTEILALYFDWILDNDLADRTVPFTQFEEWFVKLADRMAISLNHISEFDIDNMEGSRFITSDEFIERSSPASVANKIESPVECFVQ